MLTILQIFFKSIGKDKGSACVTGDSDKQQTERTPRKCVICWYEDDLIEKCKKAPKDNDKQQKKVRLSG